LCSRPLRRFLDLCCGDFRLLWLPGLVLRFCVALRWTSLLLSGACITGALFVRFPLVLCWWLSSWFPLASLSASALGLVHCHVSIRGFLTVLAVPIPRLVFLCSFRGGGAASSPAFCVVLVSDAAFAFFGWRCCPLGLFHLLR